MNSALPPTPPTPPPEHTTFATKPSALRDIFAADKAPVSSIRPLDSSIYPSASDLSASLNVEELDSVCGWLWMVGAKENVYPLHHQRVLLRHIIPTDRARLHLVWFARTIYIKPLPDCLLSYDYIREFVLVGGAAGGGDKRLRARVVGFLSTYCKLIRSPTDLRVAHELGLVTKDVDWPAWWRYRASIMENTTKAAAVAAAAAAAGGGAVTPTSPSASLSSSSSLSLQRQLQHSSTMLPWTVEPTTPRYVYGELRLTRLNIIWRCTLRGIVFFTVHKDYNSYFGQYFALFVAAFAIVATILTAMQVVVGVQGIPDAVVRVSYWFSIASILVILACLTPVLVLFLVLFGWNLGRAVWTSVVAS